MSLVQPNSEGGSSSGASGAPGASGEVGRRGRFSVGRGKEMEGEEGEAKRQSALLQVSEAHLAILPDEDGDT